MESPFGMPTGGQTSFLLHPPTSIISSDPTSENFETGSSACGSQDSLPTMVHDHSGYNFDQ